MTKLRPCQETELAAVPCRRGLLAENWWMTFIIMRGSFNQGVPSFLILLRIDRERANAKTDRGQHVLAISGVITREHSCMLLAGS